MICCCCHGKKKEKHVDICVVFDECDYEDVQPLLAVLNFPSPTGKPLNVYPSVNDKCTMDGISHSLDRAHAILIVLSDKSCAPLREENAEEHGFFKLIQKACERERLNLSRILPLFLYETIHDKNDIGLVRFSTWAYKCKNEQVRSYMEHIGSLQGVFSDPAEWQSKWDKLHSFWEEAHNALVPLNFGNMRKEVNWPLIGRTVCGTCFSLVLVASLFVMCFRWKSFGYKWIQFRRGLLLGNVVLLLLISVVFLFAGTESGDPCHDASCEQEQDFVQELSYLIGFICACAALLVFLIARLFLSREERALDKMRLAEEGKPKV